MELILRYTELLDLCRSELYDPFLADIEERCLEAIGILLRYNHNHDPQTGRFTSGNGVDNGGESGIIEPKPTGTNELQVKGFKNKQKLNNHWKNGRTHSDEYLIDGIITAEHYEKRAVELLESPVGENICGHIDKDKNIIRYDIAKNDFVKGSITKGVITMYKPQKGRSYYEQQRTEDLKHGGKA